MLLRTVILALCFWSMGMPRSMAGVLASDQGRYDLKNTEVAVLRDPAGSLKVGEVASQAMADQFSSTGRAPSLGYTQDVIWLRVTLQRLEDAPRHWAMEFTNTFINDLQFFAPADQGFEVEQAGDRFAFSQRKIAFHNPVFDLDLPDTQARTFYLRLQSDSSMSFQLRVWEPSALRKAGQVEVILLGIALGMVVMSLLVTLIQWHLSREPLLRLFSVLTALILLYMPTQLGLLSQFVFYDQPSITDILVPWTQALTIAMIILVLRMALQTPATHPGLARTLHLLAGLCIAIPLTREVGLYSTIGGPVLQLLVLFAIAITFRVSFHHWKLRKPGSTMLLLGHVVLFIPMIINRGMYLGFVPVNAFTYASWVPTLLVFLFFAQTGILVDVRAGRREREIAQDEVRLAMKIATNERQLREEQSLFFSFVAHELRSPLGVIVLGLKNLTREWRPTDNAVRERLSRVGRAAERMGALIERHLTLQRLKSGNFLLQKETVHPRLAAEEALEQVRTIFPHRVFECQDSAPLPTMVQLDVELVSLALTNLLTNAAKYSPDDSLVSLEIGLDTMLRYRVCDKGPGISTAEQERLFSAYQRSSEKDKVQGFGIGLSIAQRVATLHGGHLDYVHLVGGESIFTLSLPMTGHLPQETP